MSFFHLNLGKAIARAVGLPDKAGNIINVAFPALAATNVAYNAIASGAAKLAGGHQSHTPQALQLEQVRPEQTPGPPQSQSQLTVPYYVQPYSGSYLGFNDPYNYGPYGGGYQPWGYSTVQTPYSVQTYSVPQYQTSSQGSPIWEDLTAGLALALL
jgi:hypothetical protein